VALVAVERVLIDPILRVSLVLQTLVAVVAEVTPMSHFPAQVVAVSLS